MNDIYTKLKHMLKAYYPVLYLTSFEYDRTKQKILGIVNSLQSESPKDLIRVFSWNCVKWINSNARWWYALFG